MRIGVMVGYGANDEHQKPEYSRPFTHPTIGRGEKNA
jgi:hypothetical protein